MQNRGFGQPPRQGPLDTMTRVDELLVQLIGEVRELKQGLLKVEPKVERKLPTEMPSEAYAEENITGGTMIINSAGISATSRVADCRFWDKISFWMVNSGTYPCQVQLKGSTGAAVGGGIDIGSWIYTEPNERMAVNLRDEDWAPFIYADVYAPLATTTYPVRIRIDVVKRR